MLTRDEQDRWDAAVDLARRQLAINMSLPIVLDPQLLVALDLHLRSLEAQSARTAAEQVVLEAAVAWRRAGRAMAEAAWQAAQAHGSKSSADEYDCYCQRRREFVQVANQLDGAVDVLLAERAKQEVSE